MSKKSLRAKAEAQLLRNPATKAATRPVAEVLHELQVHQIELELQNEELRKAHIALEEARDRYVDLYEFAPVGYITISREGLINKINLTGSALLGIDRNKLVNCRFSKFVSPLDKDRWYRLFLDMMERTEVGKQAFDLEMIGADGSTLYAHLDCLRWEAADAPPMLRLTLVDISKLKRAEVDLRIAATAFESQEGMMITDANCVILRVNRAFADITGYTAEEVIGQTPRLLSSERHDAAFYAAMWESINRTGGWEGEIWDRRKNGEVYPAHLTITAVKDQNGGVTDYVATITDVTTSKAAADRIQHLAFYDPLTGLTNRRLLLERLKLALASSTRSGRESALLFLDLDNFKTLNDTLGHDIGDLLLQQVSARLTACVREGDTVARLGGDEFVVMLEELSEHALEAAAQAKNTANKILDSLNQPYRLATHELVSTASIGVTLFNDHEREVEKLLKQADIAMYQAKKSGRNTIRFFDPQMQTSVSARVALEAEMRLALAENQF